MTNTIRHGITETEILGRGQIVLMAIATGVIAANLYYAQPLLHTLGTTFHAGEAAVAIAVTVSQSAFALGLFFVVPLGDLFERRRLILALLGVVVTGMVLAAVAPNLTTFYIAMAVTGVACVAAQVIVPLAADLASPEKRGQVVGTVMSGLLMGILLARTLSGLISGISSWRAVYWVGAGLTAVLALIIRVALPRNRKEAQVTSYRALLSSTIRIFLDERELRYRAILGMAGFACFSILWSTLAFLLSAPPYRYSNGVIGLFGLVGAAGALCARSAGRLVDLGRATLMTAVFVTLIVVSLVILGADRDVLIVVLLGVVVLDVGVQGLHITNQSVIFRILPAARSRVNASYMVFYFVGGALGSAIGGATFQLRGFVASTLAGAAVGLLTLMFVGYEQFTRSRSVNLANAD